MKTYIHEGGSLGDFDFLYDVIERDKLVTLANADGYWKRERVGPFCRGKKSTPTIYLYERLKDLYIRPGSKLDDALIDLVKWAEREINKLGYKLLPRDEMSNEQALWESTGGRGGELR